MVLPNTDCILRAFALYSGPFSVMGILNRSICATISDLGKLQYYGLSFREPPIMRWKYSKTSGPYTCLILTPYQQDYYIAAIGCMILTPTLDWVNL